MIRLTSNEFLKLSEITGVPDIFLQKLYNMGLLKEDVAVDFLLRYDFREIDKRGVYQKSQIVIRLMEHYNVSKYTVQCAVTSRKRKKIYCEQCLRPTSYRQFHQNNGICNSCVAKTIEIKNITDEHEEQDN